MVKNKKAKKEIVVSKIKINLPGQIAVGRRVPVAFALKEVQVKFNELLVSLGEINADSSDAAEEKDDDDNGAE